MDKYRRDIVQVDFYGIRGSLCYRGLDEKGQKLGLNVGFTWV
jgi:hypothetical protein